MTHKFELVFTKRPGNASLRLNGLDIGNAVKHLHVDVDAGHDPAVTLDLAVTEIVTAFGTAVVGVPQETWDALTALGWTPPADDQPDLDAKAAAFAAEHGSFALAYDSTQNRAHPDSRPWTVELEADDIGWAGLTAEDALDFAASGLAEQTTPAADTAPGASSLDAGEATP